jgi:hypothetical protein
MRSPRLNSPFHPQIYVIRDLKLDPLCLVGAVKAGVAFNKKGQVTNKGAGDAAAPELHKIYQRIHGPNWRACYPWASGLIHSKIMLLRYTGFLLLVITSCNFIQADFDLSDNVRTLVFLTLVPSSPYLFCSTGSSCPSPNSLP